MSGVSVPQPIWGLSGTDDWCDLCGPGHQIHWIHFNHSMREPSAVIPVTAAVDDDGPVHIESNDGSLVRWHHRPALLRDALHRFGGGRQLSLKSLRALAAARRRDATCSSRAMRSVTAVAIAAAWSWARVLRVPCGMESTTERSSCTMKPAASALAISSRTRALAAVSCRAAARATSAASDSVADFAETNRRFLFVVAASFVALLRAAISALTALILRLISLTAVWEVLSFSPRSAIVLRSSRRHGHGDQARLNSL